MIKWTKGRENDLEKVTANPEVLAVDDKPPLISGVLAPAFWNRAGETQWIRSFTLAKLDCFSRWLCACRYLARQGELAQRGDPLSMFWMNEIWVLPLPLPYFSSWLEMEEWKETWSFEVVWVLTSEITNSMNLSSKWGNKSFMIEKRGRKVPVIKWMTGSSNQAFHWLQWNPGLRLQTDVFSNIKMVCQESAMHRTVTTFSMSQDNCEIQFYKQEVWNNSTQWKSKI